MPFDSPSRLEPEYADVFNAWKQAPTPDTASNLLTALNPSITRGIQMQLGGQDSPNLRSHARRLTLQAIKSYDPTKARLGTHVVNQLQGLKRIARRQQQVFHVPEGVALDQSYVHEHRAQLEDELGREPSVQEIADRSGLSLKRLQHISKFQRPIAEGSFSSMSNSDGEDSAFSPGVMYDPSHMWLEAVYTDLDGTNQKIIDWTLGLHGQKRLSNQQIAQRLKLSPGAVSQRKAGIQTQIGEAQELNLF